MAAMKRILLTPLTILLFAYGEPLEAAASARILTLNAWQGGQAVENGLEKLKHNVRASDADIVLLQETGAAAAYLKDELNMEAAIFDASASILSRFPVREKFLLPNGVAAILSVNGESWGVVSVHLTAYPYGPYRACFDGKSAADIVQEEDELRGAPLRVSVNRALAHFADVKTVIVGGDFNAPSHLDWTAATKERHCGYEIPFPATLHLEALGFIDAFRDFFPDPLAEPGETWSPRDKFHPEQNQAEPQDRIDMIHFRGPLKVTGAHVFTQPLDLWASDHAGVIVDLEKIEDPIVSK